MPWELSAIPSDDNISLGTVEQVQARLRMAIPEIELFRDASGMEKITASEAQGFEVPDVIRELWLRSKGSYQGLVEGEGITIEFHLDEDEASVRSILIDIRGNGDPMPLLQHLMN